MSNSADAFAELIAGKAAPAGPLADLAAAGVDRRSLSEQVANRIMAMIKSGNLKAGDRLPTEQQMAIALGISRPPLREALKALTLMGVVESRQGGRYTITDLSPTRLVAPFNAMLTAKDYDVVEHFEAREVVDCELVRLCALRASPEHRERIVQLARDGRACLEDPVAFRINDTEFHQSINLGSNNALLATVAQGLYDIALDLRRIASSQFGVIAHSVEDHNRVAEAILAHDVPAAVEAYRAHLHHVRESTIQSLAIAGAAVSP